MNEIELKTALMDAPGQESTAKSFGVRTYNRDSAWAICIAEVRAGI